MVAAELVGSKLPARANQTTPAAPTRPRAAQPGAAAKMRASVAAHGQRRRTVSQGYYKKVAPGRHSMDLVEVL